MYQLTNTISGLEVLWTAACSIGLFYAYKLLLRAGGDFTMLRRLGINSTREYAAITTVVLFTAITIVQFMFVLVGILTMFLENHPATSRGQLMVAASFLLVSVVLDLMLIIVERRRAELLKKLEKGQGDGTQPREA